MLPSINSVALIKGRPVKDRFKELLPPKVKRVLAAVVDKYRLLRDSSADVKYYLKYSGPTDSAFNLNVHDPNLMAQRLKDTHRIEKGLSLANPKRPFGDALIDRLQIHLPLESTDPWIIELVTDRLAALERWNARGEISPSAAPTFTQPNLDVDFEAFLRSRHSIRNFDPTLIVPRRTLMKCIDMSRYAPSACNRQPGRVHVYEEFDRVQEIVALQGGAKGFSSDLQQLLIVTSDISMSTGSAERYQYWIDGALMAMTLVYSLHSAGVATCLLNWDSSTKRTRVLRDIAEIPPQETPICLIAIGYPSKDSDSRTRFAASPRRPLSAYLTWH